MEPTPVIMISPDSFGKLRTGSSLALRMTESVHKRHGIQSHLQKTSNQKQGL
jgi:hypothetical protein